MPPAARDIVRNNVKDKLARDEVVASMTVRLVRYVSTGTDLAFLLAAMTERAKQAHAMR